MSSSFGPEDPQATCIWSVHQEGAIDNLEVVVLPPLLGDGIPLWPHGAQPPALRLPQEPRVSPDGSVELSYSAA